MTVPALSGEGFSVFIPITIGNYSSAITLAVQASGVMPYFVAKKFTINMTNCKVSRHFSIPNYRTRKNPINQIWIIFLYPHRKYPRKLI
ncbi:hypothetical protein D3C78_743960 [compost metagenome]